MLFYKFLNVFLAFYFFYIVFKVVKDFLNLFQVCGTPSAVTVFTDAIFSFMNELGYPRSHNRGLHFEHVYCKLRLSGSSVQSFSARPARTEIDFAGGCWRTVRTCTDLKASAKDGNPKSSWRHR